MAAFIAKAGHEGGRLLRLRLEMHHSTVLRDAVLAEGRELHDNVEAGEKVLFDSGEHVFVKVGRPADGSALRMQHPLQRVNDRRLRAAPAGSLGFRAVP
jgi:hypothetical protein